VGFREMMAAASRREFDVLVVDDSSRLSRDSADATVTLRMLDFLGVKFVARADGIDTVANGKSSRLLYGIKSAMNEEFLRDLGEKTWRGLEGRVRAGYSAGGLPYGYRSEAVLDGRGQVVGHKRVIHEPEAEVVRRIFRLYVGDEGGHPHSAREIAHALNLDGIPPAGARRQGKTTRQCATCGFTAITAHRSLCKGILHNPLYVGKHVWNKTRWLRHPVTKRETYQLRRPDEWVEIDAPELRIVPQDLWDRARARMAACRIGGKPMAPAQHRYLLSGFVKCATCGWNYIITTRHSYRCGTFKSRGPVGCSNSLAVSRRRLEATVLGALRTRLYTEERIRAITDRVREALVERARRHALETRSENRTKERRRIEREIEHVKQAVRLGKATSTLLEMLEDAERRLATLSAADGGNSSGVPERLARVLDQLPELVAERFTDLDALLADHQIERGKQILSALDTKVTLHPCGDHLEVEITGKLEGIFPLLGSIAGQKRWLGEPDSSTC